MIPQQYKLRLRAQKDFFEHAQKLRARNFSVFYQENQHGLQLTVLVPKRVIALATERNRIKRRIYQELQKNIVTLEKMTLSLVLVLQQKIVEQELEKSIHSIIETIKQNTNS
jgi:ribonuclease P protein component